MSSGIIIDVGFKSSNLESYINNLKETFSSIDFGDSIGLEKTFKEQSKSVRSELSKLESEIKGSVAGQSVADIQKRYESLSMSISNVLKILKEMAKVSPASSSFSKMINETEEVIKGVSKVKNTIEDISKLTNGKNAKFDIIPDSSVENAKALEKTLNNAMDIAKKTFSKIEGAPATSRSDLINSTRDSNGKLINSEDTVVSSYRGYKNTSNDLEELKERILSTANAYKTLKKDIIKGDMGNVAFAEANTKGIELTSTLLRLNKTYEKLTGEKLTIGIDFDKILNDFKLLESRVYKASNIDEDGNLIKNIKGSISSTQTLIDSGNNLIIGLKVSDSASKTLYNEASSVIDVVSSQLSTNPLEVRVAVVSGYRSTKIKDYLNNIYDALGGVEDSETKKRLSKVVSDLQYQVDEALHLKVEIEGVNEVEGNVRKYITDLQTAFKEEKFTVTPSVEITDAEKEKIRTALQEISDSTTIDVKFSTTNETENKKNTSSKKTANSSISISLSELSKQLDNVNSLVENLSSNYLDSEDLFLSALSNESSAVNQLYSEFLLLNQEIENTQKMLAGIKTGNLATDSTTVGTTDDAKNDISKESVKIPVTPNLTGFSEAIQSYVDKNPISIKLVESKDANALRKLIESLNEIDSSLADFSSVSSIADVLSKLIGITENSTSAITNLKLLISALRSMSSLSKNNSFEALSNPISKLSSSLESLSKINESPILNQLTSLTSDTSALKDLATVLTASKSNINNAKQNMLQQAKNYLTTNHDVISSNFSNFITGNGGTIITQEIKATKEGLIEISALIKNITGEYEKFVYTTKDGNVFSETSSVKDIAGFQKKIDAWEAYQKVLSHKQNNPSNFPTDIELNPNTQGWKELVNLVTTFGIDIENVVRIVQQLDKDGNETFQVFDKFGGRTTLGLDSDQILYFKKEILDSENTLESFKEKVKSLYSYISSGMRGKNTSISDFTTDMNEVLSLYKQLQDYQSINLFDATEISDLEKYFNLFISSINSVSLDKIKNVSNETKTPKFVSDFNEADKLLEELRESFSKGLGVDNALSDNDISKLEKFISLLQELYSTQKDKNVNYANENSINKLVGKINKDMTNTGMPKALMSSYKTLKDEIDSLGKKIPNDKMTTFNSKFSELHSQLVSLDPGLSFFDEISKKASNATKNFISYYFSLQDFIRYGKELFNIINEIDTAMTELKRVTDLSSSSYDTLFEKATESAVNYGRTISETITSTASWVRLGFDADDAVDLSGVSAMYQNVTDLDEDTAVDNLVTAYKGFEDQLLEANSGDKVAAVTQITDVYDKLGNEFAESASDVGDGLSKAASVLSQAGADINEAAGLFTGINEVLQDSSTSGQALKIITLRIRGMSGELEELGEDVDDDVDSISKMQTQVLNLTHGKVNIFDDDGNFRNVYDILKDIANIYDELTSTEQASLLEKLAGKNRANALAALFSNWDNAEAATEAARNSSGTAEAENEVYMDSIDGRVAQFQARVQQLASDFASSDVMKGLVSVATEFITILDTIIDKLGSIPLIVAGIKTAIAVKDVKSTGNIGESFLYTFLGIDNEELRKKAKAKKLGVVDDDASGDIDVAESLGNQQQSVDGLVSANDALINSENQVVDAMEHTIDASGDVVDSLSEITDATDDASGDIDDIIDRANGAGDNSEESASGTGKKLMSAFNLVSSIATVAWGVGSTIYNAWKEYKENLLQQANETTEAWNTSKESIESYAEQYQNIKTQISTGELTEAEGMNQLYELQQQIVEEYGKAAENVDLTNGSLSQQLEILKNISVEQARSNLSDSDNLKAYKDSEKEMTSKKTTNGTFGANTNDDDNLSEALDKAIEAANKLAGDGTLSKNGNSVQATFYGSVAEKSLFLENFEEEINTLKDAVDSEAGLTSDEKNSVREYYTQILADVQEVFSSVSDTVSDYGENYKSYLEQKLYDKTIESSTTGKTENMGLIMAEYSDALEAYKEGISTGVSDDELLVLKNDFEELNAIKEEFISNPDNAEFSYYFQDLDDSYDELMKSVKKNNFEKAIANGTNASSKSLKNLNKSVSEYKKNIRNISFGSDTFENVEKLRKATSTAFARLAKEAAEAGVIDSAYNTDDLETLIDYLGEAKILVKDASSITFDDAKQSLEDFTSDLSDAKTDLETLQTIMGESSSGTGVTSDNITAFKKLFGDDAQKAIERTTNGYHLNTEALKELQKKQEQLQKSTYYDALKDQYAALKNVNEQLILSEVAGNNDRVTSLTNERNELLKNIESIKDEQMAYEGLTSTFAKWKNAQSQSTEHDDYASLVSGLTTVDEEFQKGWFTSDQSRTYLDTLVSEDLTNASAEEIIAARAKLNQAIEGTTYKISDFLTKDSSGNATADGAVAMLEAIKQIYGDSIYTTDENGDQVFDFVGRDEEIANRLGMDVSGFQKILQALGDSGYVVNLDQPIKSIEELKTEATEAKASLDEVETTNEDLKGINLDSDNFSDIYEDMENVNSYIQEISDNDELDVDVKDDRIENANKLLAYMSEHLNELKDEGNIDLTTSWDENEVNDNIKELEDKLSSYKNSSGQIDSRYYDSEGNINDSTLESYISQLQLMIQLKNEYSRPTVLSIDTSEMDDEMASAVSLLNSYRDSLSLLEANKAAGVDTTEAEQKIASYKEQLDAIENTEIRTTLRLDYVTDLGTDSGTDAFDNALQQVDVNTVLNSDNVDNYNPEEKTATVTYTKNSQEPDSYEMGFALGRHNQTATITYTIQTQGATPSLTVGTSSGDSELNGTAHANGNWGTKKTETALVGELGREIVVDGKTGTWQTVGDNGAEFRKIPSGSIIFNHKQTEDLLKNGYVTSRGKTVSGSAWLKGTAYSSVGGKNLLAQARSVSKSSSTASSASDAASSASDAASSASDAASSASDAAEDTSETMDYIEIKIDRIERIIDNLSTIAESEYNTYQKRNEAATEQIAKVREEIDIQQQAYDRYMQQANSVGLSEEYAQKIRDGLIDIEEITDETLKDNISDYQEWLVLATLHSDMHEKSYLTAGNP